MKEESVEEEIANYLEHYTVEYPDDDAIDQTIESLRAYVPEPQSNGAAIREKLQGLLRHSAREISVIGSLFWVMNVIFFICGFSYVLFFEGDPYSTMFFLAPIPFLIGLGEVFKGREAGLYEIELACKYSAQHIMMSRLFVIGTYNFVISAVLICALSVTIENILLLKLVGYWILPTTLVSSVGLFLTIRFRSSITVPVTLAIWFTTSMMISQSVDMKNYLESLSAGVYSIALIASLVFLFLQINRIKRGVRIEAND
ncbi:hypothetical protein [Guptibacillus algicola]|uniref:hypothetical protein n=1 Tax=Guptibacillus algicola TaxID=225844 RepID=UPI001CD3375C|nr:hypothetical protein [Alkalihalobacillus algicola]MCA0987515.1 hypothetical protein [Alkalihalobacillus algicola]